MAAQRDNPFAFLANAKPGSLFKLLDRLPRQDQAMVLAHLPPWLTAQVMAYFSDSEQGVLLSSMREARRATPEDASATVGKLRDILAASKDALQTRPNPQTPPTPSSAANASASPKPGIQATDKTIASAYGKSSLPPNAKPQPWKPRTTDETPINAPQKPNRPPPVAGAPARSPIKANILEMLGFGKTKAEPDAPTPPAHPRPPAKSEPKEGLVRSPKLTISNTPRMLGAGKPVSPSAAAPAAPKQRASSPPASGGRKMDGMAIMAAILRNASVDVRHNVEADSPALFKALKDRMFVFDDLVGSDDDALAQVFTVAPLTDAALALRFGPPALRDRALRAVSPRRAAMIKDAVTNNTTRSGLDAIEEAQNRVLDVALRLQSAGRIIIDPDDPDLAT